MKRIVPILLISVLGACATQRSLVSVPMTLGPAQEEVVGVVSGSSMADYYPFVSGHTSLGVEGDSLKAAFEDALKDTGAHTLINVTADKRCRFVPFPVFYIFARCRVSVTGTAVRYKNMAAPQPAAAAAAPAPVVPAPAAPVAKAPAPPVGAFNPSTGAPPETFYSELSQRYHESLKEARRFYKEIGAEDRSRLETFIVKSKGRVKGRRFLIDKTLPSPEKTFLLWYMPKTKYRAIVR